MVRALVYFFVAIVVLGTIATPGLGAFALVAVPLVGLGLVWRIAVTVATHGHPGDAVVRTRHSHLLGPGGPDDSFAAYRLDDDGYPAEAISKIEGRISGARNGLVQGANVPPTVLAESPSGATRTFHEDA